MVTHIVVMAYNVPLDPLFVRIGKITTSLTVYKQMDRLNKKPDVKFAPRVNSEVEIRRRTEKGHYLDTTRQATDRKRTR